MSDKLVDVAIESSLEIGVGPISIRVDMARELGWSDDEIRGAFLAIRLISLGTSRARELREGRACESCQATDARPEYLPCVMCGRKKEE